MNFMTRFSKVLKDYDCLNTFMDRLTTQIHFIPSRDSDTAENAENCFFETVYILHRLPDSIVSDKNTKFTLKFRRRQCPTGRCNLSVSVSLCRVKLEFSISKPSQQDLKAQIMNRMISIYLMCYCAHHQQHWDDMLAVAEFPYSSATVDSLRVSPSESQIRWLHSLLDLQWKRTD